MSKLIGAYPNGGANAGKSYIGAIAAVLCNYPRSIALQCANPASGVARATRFLPTVADVVGWCEPRVQSMYERVAKDDRITEQLRERTEFDARFGTPEKPKNTRYNLFVRAGRPRYEEMCERAEKATARGDTRDFLYSDGGIWVPLTWWHER